MMGYILLGGLALLTVASLVAHVTARRGYSYCDGYLMLALFLGVILATTLAIVPLQRASIHAKIAGHYATGETLARARENDFDGFERATLQREVVDSNRSLAETQVLYHYWKPFIPAAVLDVEPIE